MRFIMLHSVSFASSEDREEHNAKKRLVEYYLSNVEDSFLSYLKEKENMGDGVQVVDAYFDSLRTAIEASSNLLQTNQPQCRRIDLDCNKTVTEVGVMKHTFFKWLISEVHGEVLSNGALIRTVPESWCQDEITEYMFQAKKVNMIVIFNGLTNAPGCVNVVIQDSVYEKSNVTATFSSFPNRFDVAGAELDDEIWKLTTIRAKMITVFFPFINARVLGKIPIKRPFGSSSSGSLRGGK